MGDTPAKLGPANKPGEVRMYTPIEVLYDFRNGHLNEYLRNAITVKTLEALGPDELFTEQIVRMPGGPNGQGQAMKRRVKVKEAMPDFVFDRDRNLATLKSIDALLESYGEKVKKEYQVIV